MRHPWADGHFHGKAERQRGVGLLEWVVALGLNALVLLILTQALLGARVSFSMIDATARLSDNGRFAQDAIAQSLTQASAGLPCGRAVNNPLLEQFHGIQRSPGLIPNVAVVGWEASGTQGPSWSLSVGSAGNASTGNTSTHPSLPPALAGRVDPQSDVLLVHRKTPVSGVRVTHLESNRLDTELGHGLRACSILVLSDCTTDHTIQVTQVSTRSLHWSVGDGCEPSNESLDEFDPARWPDWNRIALYQWQAMAWFVGPEESGQRTLYRALFDEGQSRVRVEAMVEGIETLQIEYASHDPLQPMQWQSADAITDWRSVVGVRFGVLASARIDGSPPHQNQITRQLLLGTEVLWPASVGYVRAFQTAQALRGTHAVLSD